MFRPGGMIESSKQEVRMERHDKDTFSRMLEFLYTGKSLYSTFKLFPHTVSMTISVYK